MKKIKLYIAASLDGYIARPDGDLEWLTGFPNPSKTDYGYKDFLATVDTVVMGGHTYHDILAMDVVWPYKEQMTYVVSHHSSETTENIYFITENVVGTIDNLKKKEGKDIWLAGGGELISILLDAGLVDEMQIFHIPVMLGHGIRLFPNPVKESQWNFLKSKPYDNGVLEVKYQRR